MNFKKLEEMSVNVYVMNFLKTMIVKDLWRLCERHGAVADVYIPRKLSNLGKRFAFVRFMKSKEYTHVDDLNCVWIGSYHVCKNPKFREI